MKPKPLPKDRKLAAIAIAKDVLAQIRARKIVARSRTYFWPAAPGVNGCVNYDEEIRPAAKQLAEAVAKVETCTACAIGASVMSYARLYNKCEAKPIFDGDDIYMRRMLRPVFGDDQLAEIERCFEGTDGDVYLEYEAPDMDAVEKWVNKAPQNDEKRLQSIMKNIIRNRGRFVVADTRGPSARTPYKEATV